MTVDDARMGLSIRHDIVKRPIDSSRLEVRVFHGVVYLTGEVKSIRGQPCDLRKEMEVIHHAIRTRTGIRDVVDEVRLKEPLNI
jgi:osmotically-inducible protein OsmY